MPWDERLKSYLRTTVLILDAPESMHPPNANVAVNKHDFNCRKMRIFFTNYSDAKVVWIHMPAGTGKKDFLRRIDHELEGMTEDDLVIVYFEGHAYGENEKWHWDFTSGPDRIKRSKVVDKFYETPADCMLILDCHTHDRLATKWNRPTGNTEIITTGTEHKEHSGKAGYSVGNDFTDGILVHIEEYVDELVKRRKREEAAAAAGRPLKEREPYKLRTLPELLRNYKPMFSNANRPDRKRTKAGGKEIIMRFVVDPNLVKQTGKLEFFAKLLQGEIEDDMIGAAADEVGATEGDGQDDDQAPPDTTAVSDTATNTDEGYGSIIGHNHK